MASTSGAFGFLIDELYGGTDYASRSGAFDLSPGISALPRIGDALSKRIDELMGDFTTTDMFRRGVAGIRDQGTLEARGLRANLTKAGSSGGFLDSGAIGEGLGAIESGRLASFSKGVTDLVNSFASRADNLALPFLAAGVQENAQFGKLNLESSLTQRQQNIDVGEMIASLFAG